MNDKMILIVDDESRIRKLIKDFIEQEEYSVLEAADGEEAVEQFESNINYSIHQMSKAFHGISCAAEGPFSVCTHVEPSSQG